MEPTTAAEVKTHTRIDTTSEDSMLEDDISAARELAEKHTQRVFITQTWNQFFDRFPCSSNEPIRLLNPPLQSVSSITYLDANGDSQTWSSSLYQVDTNGVYGQIKPIEGQTYPSTQNNTFNTVTVEFVAGYGDAASDVPPMIRKAIRQIVAYWYKYRESVSDNSVYELPDIGKKLLSSFSLEAVF